MGKTKATTAFPFKGCKRAVKSMHSSAPYGFHPMIHFDVSFDMPRSYCRAERERSTTQIINEKQSSVQNESLRLLFVHHLQPGAFIQSFNFRDNKNILAQHDVGYETKYYFDNKSQTSEKLAEESPPSNFAIEVLMNKPVPTFPSSSSPGLNKGVYDDECSVDLNFEILMHLRYQMAVFDDTTHKTVNISTPEIYMAYIDNDASPFVSSAKYFSFFPTKETSLFLNEKFVHIQDNQYEKIQKCVSWDKVNNKVDFRSHHALETVFVPVADARDFDFVLITTNIVYFITGTYVLMYYCYVAYRDTSQYYKRYRTMWLLKKARRMQLKDKDE